MEQKAMISPATIERLLSIDTSFFGIPSYRKETKNGQRKDIWYLKNVIRFVTFCKDLDQMNQTAGLGFVVGRALAEAAWCKTVIRVYKRMDEGKQQREGKEFQANLMCLNDCLRQRHSQGALKYWLDKNAQYQGLDTFTPLDDEDDHSTELATWVLTMLKENTDKIINAQMEKQIKQMGKMDLGEDDDDDAGVDMSEAGLRKKAKAEQEGLIKIIEEKLEKMDLDG